MSEAEAHGVALICEREGGHTVAWVDAQQSRRVPAGYFVESWFEGRYHAVHAGTLDGGYFTEWNQTGNMEWFAEWHSFDKAVAWCEYDARQRQARKQLITYGMLGAMLKEESSGGAA